MELLWKSLFPLIGYTDCQAFSPLGGEIIAQDTWEGAGVSNSFPFSPLHKIIFFPYEKLLFPFSSYIHHFLIGYLSSPSQEQCIQQVEKNCPAFNPANLRSWCFIVLDPSTWKPWVGYLGYGLRTFLSGDVGNPLLVI